MQWAVKKYLLATSSLLLLSFLSLLLTSREEISLDYFPEVTPSTTLTCYNSIDSTLRVTTKSECPPGLISLGSGAISQSDSPTAEITRLHPILEARFSAAQSAAKLEGVNLYITSGFRSLERQAQLFAEAVGKYGSETEAAKWVLPPQFSHHPEGLAIDVNYPGDRPGAQWLEEHGARFGLCRVYGNEWWHFEGPIAPGESCPAMAANALVDLG
jgi:hypothetical protein